MPANVIQTVTAQNVKVGDIHATNVVADVYWEHSNVYITYEDGQTTKVALTTEIEVLRSVPTWDDKIADSKDSLSQAIEDVRAMCHAATANPERRKVQAKIADAGCNKDLIHVMRNYDLDMMRLHLEDMWLALGTDLEGLPNMTVTDATDVVLSHLAGRVADLLDWTIPERGLDGSTADRNAFHMALRNFISPMSLAGGVKRHADRVNLLVHKAAGRPGDPYVAG